ncbi:hypothetical protein QAD02_018432 [Eretmocerus hayati]|uniref:Uncharacterized protein n=1 Tax=Eretmocerus hayati TaxID=131215 RepID=A0ACC2PGU3_9HYME|nr:hypothetical protein QAD02_018432 [Eretmocerus hayati]
MIYTDEMLERESLQIFFEDEDTLEEFKKGNVYSYNQSTLILSSLIHSDETMDSAKHQSAILTVLNGGKVESNTALLLAEVIFGRVVDKKHQTVRLIKTLIQFSHETKNRIHDAMSFIKSVEVNEEELKRLTEELLLTESELRDLCELQLKPKQVHRTYSRKHSINDFKKALNEKAGQDTETVNENNHIVDRTRCDALVEDLKTAFSNFTISLHNLTQELSSKTRKGEPELHDDEHPDELEHKKGKRCAERDSDIPAKIPREEFPGRLMPNCMLLAEGDINPSGRFGDSMSVKESNMSRPVDRGSA